MKRVLGLCLALGILLVTSPLSAAEFSPVIDRQPLVSYDVSGYGIGGPIHLQLSVYSDGLTSISWKLISLSHAEFVFVSEQRAYQLLEELTPMGVMDMKDREEAVADMPMATVTVFDGNSDSASHNTFSFFNTGDSRDPYRMVTEVLSAFIDELGIPDLWTP